MERERDGGSESREKVRRWRKWGEGETNRERGREKGWRRERGECISVGRKRWEVEGTVR